MNREPIRIPEIQYTVFGTSLKMAKTTNGSNWLINPIHPNLLHLVEPQPVRSGYERKHSIVYPRVGMHRVDQPVRSGSDPSIYCSTFCFCQPDVTGWDVSG